MTYDKGPQLTVGILKQYLAHIPDNVKVCFNDGQSNYEVHYILNKNGELTFAVDCYMQDANETNLRTLLSFNKK